MTGLLLLYRCDRLLFLGGGFPVGFEEGLLWYAHDP
jgi:hypothetical protein